MWVWDAKLEHLFESRDVVGLLVPRTVQNHDVQPL
jgi:hypothetical protein